VVSFIGAGVGCLEFSRVLRDLDFVVTLSSEMSYRLPI
jgi:hypothetical protein